MAISDILGDVGDLSGFSLETPVETLTTLPDILTDTDSAGGANVSELPSGGGSVIVIED
jgi:hypothetical protein